MHWLYLGIAIICEIAGTLSIKQTTLSQSYLWGGLVVVLYGGAFYFMILAVKKIEISTAYAIWAGFGTAAIALFGWLIFKESMSFQKIFAIALIIVGSVMLKLEHS